MRSLLFPLLFLPLACAIPADLIVPDADPAPTPTAVPLALVAVDREQGELTWLVRSDGSDCRIDEFTRAATISRTAQLPCGSRLLQTREALLVIDDRNRGTTAVDLATFEPEASALLDRRGEWALEWSDVGLIRRGPAGVSQLPSLRAARLLENGVVIGIAPVPGGGETLVLHAPGVAPVDLLADAAVTRIESWDPDPKGGELVFSARRADGNMDIGLAATSGAAMRWIPAEPGDEYAVTWAPRGNKVTWMIDTAAGVVMRTAHIPTGYQLSVPLGYVAIESIAWEPAAEKVYIAMSSPRESLHVTSIRYGGENRALFIPPAERLRRQTQQLADLPGSLLVPPATVQYGHRYPVTIVAADSSYGWDRRFAAAADEQEGAVLWVPRGDTDTLARARKALGEIGWVDTAAVYVHPRE